MIYSLLGFLWFFRQIKFTLFWIYLWQLKEYHLGRFIDHFRTEKGKRIFLNKLLILKFILIFYFLLFWQNFSHWAFIFSLLILIYFFESIKTFLDLIFKRLKKPVWTKKTIFLTIFSLSIQIIYLSSSLQEKFFFPFYLLIFDFFTPAIISGILLFFQPLSFFWRNRLIKKAKEKREKFKKLIVIGITGSYGKSSTKEILAKILSEKFKVLKTKENQNSEVGISQCILNDLKPEHEVFIVEMGAYNKGGIKLLCDIAKPQIGIVTGVNEQHLSTFGSMENLLSAEGGEELIESLPPMGFAVFNGDNIYCRELYKKTSISKGICYTKFFSPTAEVMVGDFWVREIKVGRQSLSFKVFSRWGEIVEFKVNLFGEFLIQNILMAAVVAKEVLGMTLEEIAQTCQKIKPEEIGISLKKVVNNLNIIKSTYSTNPDGVIAHLDYLKIWPGQKVIVMPCLIELGSASKEVHYRIGEKIGRVCDLAIITTKERFKEIALGAIKNGMKRENIMFSENPKEIFKIIKTFCQPEDVVLLEGRVPEELIKILLKNEI